VPGERSPSNRACLGVATLAAIVGASLVIDTAMSSSATYDEVTYLRVAAQWWRTGDQEPITRMGSPLGFWKYQQSPTLWLIDRVGFGRWIDDPDTHQATLLPYARIGSLWIWAAALALTVTWARLLNGPRAMAFAAWVFALSPNLIAHGALITMEMPLIASVTASGLGFTIFLRSGSARAFAASAALAGLAFTCKFTAILIPPLCALCWLARDLSRSGARPFRTSTRVALGMSGFTLILIATDLGLTGFARLPLSERVGQHPSLEGRSSWVASMIETPIPADWVGFANQTRHQRSGGPSYLLGERRMAGWWYYYLVAMAVKIPPVVWGLVLARVTLVRRRRDCLLPLAIVAFLLITSIGSTRNYGVRYVLPIAPLAIVWLSALAEGGRAARGAALAGVVGVLLAISTTHPRELAYFPYWVGGPEGGRRILSDSNLDWGQGLRDLARLQRDRPEYRDLTLYYFGLGRPEVYGVAGRSFMIDAGDLHHDLPARLNADTRFVAVSASLQFGPWGPPGYFDSLNGIKSVARLPDYSIAIYRFDEIGEP